MSNINVEYKCQIRMSNMILMVGIVRSKDNLFLFCFSFCFVFVGPGDGFGGPGRGSPLNSLSSGFATAFTTT